MQENKKPSIRIFHVNERQKIKKKIETEVIVLLRGKLVIDGANIPAGSMLVLPPGESKGISFEAETTVAFLSLEEHIGFCRQLIPGRTLEDINVTDERCRIMPLKPQLEAYMQLLCYILRDDLIPGDLLFDVKLKEFVLLLIHYYTPAELESFFRPLLGGNTHFRLFVLNHYREVKTVREFASMAHLSISGFEREFHRTFQSSPYRWMKQKRMEELLRLITLTDKSLKEITEECGFSSTSQMNDFCKKEWGKTPGRLRKEQFEKTRLGGYCE